MESKRLTSFRKGKNISTIYFLFVNRSMEEPRSHQENMSMTAFNHSCKIHVNHHQSQGPAA